MSHVQDSFVYGALTRYGGPFQVASTHYPNIVRDKAPHRPYNPERPKTLGLGSSPFARRYFGNLA